MKDADNEERSPYELNSCPICGSDWTFYSGDPGNNYAACGKCHAKTKGYEKILDAAHAWNRGEAVQKLLF